MAIPKVIYQTYSASKTPLFAQFQKWRFMKKNKDFTYEIYDDQMRLSFIKNNFNAKIFKLYAQIQIAAAKADFFRYAILYINGGIYIDIDSTILIDLNHIIKPTSTAIIATEKTNTRLYAQWALMFEKKHPILKDTLAIILNNMSNGKHKHSVHEATGPMPYSIAVHKYLRDHPHDVNLTIADKNYKGIFQFKTIVARIHHLFNKKKHWRNIQLHTPVYNSPDQP